VKTIEASFEIVTPMFISGGDNEADLRPPSIKGALRFWWRALHWGQCLQETDNEKEALKQLYKLEAELFGAAVNNGEYGQGKLLLKLNSGFKNNEFKDSPPLPGTTYLLGQGLYNNKYLSANQSFTLTLKIREPKVPDDSVIEGVINSLLLWGLLGGLGSRGRKGFGSVSISSLKLISKNNGEATIEERPIPKTKDSYKQTVESLLKELSGDLPSFTALSSKTRIDISNTGNNAENLLNNIGMEMQLYRSYGRKNKNGQRKVAGKDAEMNFESDHHIMFDFSQGKNIQEHPKRVVFGLPHNYFFSSNKCNIDVNAVDSTMQGKDSQYRRSSPLFIHIHKLKDNEYIAVQSLIPATFLPAEYKIRLEIKKTKKKVSIPCKIDWDDIHTYLNRFEQREKIL